MLQAVLSAEDFAKYRDLPKLYRVNRSWPTRSKNKKSFKNKLTITVRWFSREREAKPAKLQTRMSDLCIQVFNPPASD